METQPHPLIQRFAAVRDTFAPELTDDELRQMQEIADANPDMELNDLNLKLNEEFGLQGRFDTQQRREHDVDQMTRDFRELIEKWKIVPMADSLVVAGSVLHHLNGLSAVMGCYIEDLHKRATAGEKPENVVEIAD
jgi:hypothetical protein